MSRIALAIQVVASEVGQVPTLIFDEVDSGIGGAVAATVGGLLQTLGGGRQVLCVTHLPQVAAFADPHFRVSKTGDGDSVTSDLARSPAADRVEELARMLGGAQSPQRLGRTRRSCSSNTGAEVSDADRRRWKKTAPVPGTAVRSRSRRQALPMIVSDPRPLSCCCLRASACELCP